MSQIVLNPPTTLYMPTLRDERGLLSPDKINYKFNKDGTVDWKSMIPLDNIVFNHEWFERNNIAVPEFATLAEVENPEIYNEKQLLVLLAGYKEVAKIRGLLKVEKTITRNDDLYCAVCTKVTFCGNFETDGKELVYEETANANIHNVNDFFVSYLETIASNRSFVRAVRNALRIDIVGSDEISSRRYASNNSESESKVDVHAALIDACSRYETEINGTKTKLDSFEKFRTFMTTNPKALANFPQASTWSKWKDIPLTNVWTLLKGIGQKIN